MLGVEGLENIQGYRIMKLAIKKPKAVFWKTDLRVEDIQKMLQAEKITEEWLVCPQGEVGDAVLISEFLANPSIFFESIFKSYSHEQKDEAKTKPKKNDLKKRIIIAVLKGYAIGAVTGAIFVSLVTGVIGIRAFFAALIMAPLTLFYFGDVLEILGFILLGVAITQFVALLVNGRRTGRPRLIVTGSFVLAALLAFLGGSTAAYVVYAY